MKRISMKDIARELDISITTVSFVINGKSEEMGISPATANKVHELIKKRGFNPNSAAQMLRTGKSKTIGLIVEDIGNYFFGNIAKVIEKAAHKNGYNVFFSSTEGNDDTAKELINKMRTSSVDGYIITATRGLKEELVQLKKEKVPFVLLDRLVPGVETNYVILDNYRGAYDLTRHLIKKGYKNIGFVSISNGMSQMVDRQRGFMDALSDHKISLNPKMKLEVKFNAAEENSITTIKKYISRNPTMDALFFTTNYLGVLGIEALQRSGLSIPGDIAVVSFDDNDLFRLLTPSITVAAQPINEIANKSIELLFKMIRTETNQRKPIGEVIQPEIIIRNSSPSKKTARLVR